MDRAADLPGLGGSLAWSLVSLGAVCLIAYASLRLLSRRLGPARSGPIRVLARCPLEPRRSLVLVEVAGRCLLVGLGDGPMTMLAELTEAERALVATAGVGADGTPGPSGFLEVLGRVLRRDRSSASSLPPGEGPLP